MTIRSAARIVPQLVLAAAMLALPTQAVAAPSVFGRWMTQDRAAIVRIQPCGRSLCGIADRVLDPAAPANDIRNPDPALRSRPLIGATILSGFRQEGAEWTGGLAYSPKVGRSYKSRLKLLPDGRLQITGCVMFICRSLVWTRVS